MCSYCFAGGEKGVKISFMKHSGARVCWPVPIILTIYYLGDWDWEDEVRGQPRQIAHESPSLKQITRAKWTGDVVQAVEYFLHKREVLSSNPISLSLTHTHARAHTPKKTTQQDLETCGPTGRGNWALQFFPLLLKRKKKDAPLFPQQLQDHKGIFLPDSVLA
jgi:hypothetical protein